MIPAIKRLFGLKTEKTREELVDFVSRAATDNIHYILGDVTDETRDQIIPAVEVRLSAKAMGPEVLILRDDLRAGRGHDLLDSMSDATVPITGMRAIATDDPDIVIVRVGFHIVPPSKSHEPA